VSNWIPQRDSEAGGAGVAKVGRESRQYFARVIRQLLRLRSEKKGCIVGMGCNAGDSF